MHKKNRGGLGFVAPIDVQILLLSILSSKFTASLVEHALSLQLPPKGDKEGGMLREFNVDIALKSNGVLPTCVGSSLLSVTLTCGHTVGALRCCLLGAKAALPGLQKYCDDDGCLSMEKIKILEPLTHEAALNGIPIEQIRWEVALGEPRLLTILMRGDNVGHHSARLDTEWQVIHEIHASVCGVPTKEEWAKLAREATMYREAHAESAEHYVAFVEAMEPILPFVFPIVDKYISMITQRRIVRGALWRGLADGGLRSCERVMAALVCCMFGTSKHEQNQSRIFRTQ